MKTKKSTPFMIHYDDHSDCIAGKFTNALSELGVNNFTTTLPDLGIDYELKSGDGFIEYTLFKEPKDDNIT